MRALQMLQKLMSKPRAFCGTLDQTWHVGDHKAAVITHAHDTEIRMQCGERIISHLWTCRRDRADERRFAGVGHAQQSHIGEHF